MIKNKPKILVFDEETSPMRGYFFGSIWETNIVGDIEYETIVCISYWDSETNKVKNIAQWDFPGWKKGKWDDKKLLQHFRKIVVDGDYDIIAGQNSDQFDIKLLNSRLIFHDLEPIPEYKTLDTKKIAKSKLKLPSYSLDFMAKYFGLGGKYHHSGLDMWFKSRDGDKKAQREMSKYCDVDVIRTKDVLYKLLPFMKQFNDFTKINPHKEFGICCSNPLCLSKNLTPHKNRRVVNGWKLQYQCNDCGKYTTDAKMVRDEK